jgi:NADPH:quinone reductase-like Zn-dependent oxidoreductase
MRAMVFDRYGEPDVMRLRELPVPEPQEGEVLIRVGYAGVNPADSKTRAGLSTRAGVAFPFVTGMDAAGVIERRGAKVAEFRRGGSRHHLGRSAREGVGHLRGIRSCFREPCRANAEEPKFRPSGGCSHCVAGRLSVSLPSRTRRHDPGSEGAH